MKTRSTVMAKSGLVVCSQPRAALAGVQVLLRGGNAVDAAVATAAVLSVLEPMSVGIGGDAFALLYLARPQTIKALDASGRSPYGASAEFYSRQGLKRMPESGIHSVTVPGALHGWVTLLEAYGALSLAESLDPAIECAEEGFPVGELTSEHWQKSRQKLLKNPEAASTYLIGGNAPKAGEPFRQPNLARTLRKIAKEGPGIFYEGEIAEKIVRCSQRLGGLFSPKDLADHRSDWVEPITAAYRGYEVFELPPSTQGLVALSMLKMLEPYGLNGFEHNGAEYLHLLIEAKKLAFADRDRYVADRDFMKVPWQMLISNSHVEAMRKTISRDRVRPEAETVPLGGDTEYLAVADREGNLVSFIQSLFTNFGSGVVVEDTGIALQNRGHLFSLDEKHPNCIGPHKRSLHTLMPGMVFKDGSPFAALGLKGGHVQPQVQLQILLNLIDFNMTAQEALTAPRFNHLSGLEVALEPEFSPGLVRALQAKGHKIVTGPAESFGGAHAIVLDGDSGTLRGGSDPRKEGCALGF